MQRINYYFNLLHILVENTKRISRSR